MDSTVICEHHPVWFVSAFVVGRNGLNVERMCALVHGCFLCFLVKRFVGGEFCVIRDNDAKCNSLDLWHWKLHLCKWNCLSWIVYDKCIFLCVLSFWNITEKNSIRNHYSTFVAENLLSKLQQLLLLLVWSACMRFLIAFLFYLIFWYMNWKSWYNYLGWFYFNA